MSKRFLILLLALFLAVPLMIAGCGSSGDDGSKGDKGDAGDIGPPGPPGSGAVALETCALCHGKGQGYDVAAMHNLDADGNWFEAGTLTLTVNSLTFGTPVGDNVPVTVDFDFAATNAAGNPVTVNLNQTSGSNLAYIRFTLAKLVPGTAYPVQTTQEPDQWYDYSSGSRVPANLINNGGGNYTYTFPATTVTLTGGANPAAAFADNAVTRLGIQVGSLPASLFTTAANRRAPVINVTYDEVPLLDGPPTAAYPSKDTVTTAACQGCHDPLGVAPNGFTNTFHSGARYDTQYCVTCHNPTLAGGEGNLVTTVHKIHTSQDFELGDYTHLLYPQDIRNCTTCHKGTDGDNWKSRPSMEACGSCHTSINWGTGAGHTGGAQANNQFCGLCHSPAYVTAKHATIDNTPNNRQLPTGLSYFEYGVNSVTVNASRQPVVKFWVKKDGAFVNLKGADNNAVVPTGFSDGPSFLLAWADNVTTPADYSNFGRSAAQPPSVSLVSSSGVGLPLTGTSSEFTVTLTTAYPAGATMRAIGMQGAYNQLNVDMNGNGTIEEEEEEVEIATISVNKEVTGDAVRRTVVKSGYNAVTGAPEGCLECHEMFRGHGGSRVNNVQVCVMCHNPNLTSSARTIDPTSATPINSEIVSLFGSNPLTYPEVPNNMKELIHGLHAGYIRETPFQDIRNRTTGGAQGVYVTDEHIGYPGNLNRCTKCHVGDSYKADLATGVLFTTAKITTGDAAETRTQIVAARATVANDNDLVNSPITSACGYCHNTAAAISHFVVNGGDVKTTRSTAEQAPPPLAPFVALPMP